MAARADASWPEPHVLDTLYILDSRDGVGVRRSPQYRWARRSRRAVAR
jgi:hypothetical protein